VTDGSGTDCLRGALVSSVFALTPRCRRATRGTRPECRPHHGLAMGSALRAGTRVLAARYMGATSGASSKNHRQLLRSRDTQVRRPRESREAAQRRVCCLPTLISPQPTLPRHQHELEPLEEVSAEWSAQTLSANNSGNHGIGGCSKSPPILTPVDECYQPISSAPSLRPHESKPNLALRISIVL
jgi:hypothetical protein